MSVRVGERVGCVTVVEVLEAAQARERELCGYRGRLAHPRAQGTHAWVRCDCLLEFLVRARELWRRKKHARCGKRCELGLSESPKKGLPEWTHCRNPMCGRELNPRGMGRRNRTGFCHPCQNAPGARRWYQLGRPDAAEAAAKRSKIQHQRKEARRAHGQCLQCGTPCEGRLCDPHRARHNELRLIRQARYARAGICAECRRIAVSGRTRCEKHLADNAARAVARYWRTNEAGRAAAERGAA